MAPPGSRIGRAESITRTAHVLLVDVMRERTVQHTLVAKGGLGTAVAFLWTRPTTPSIIAGFSTLTAGYTVGVEVVSRIAT